MNERLKRFLCVTLVCILTLMAVACTSGPDGGGPVTGTDAAESGTVSGIPDTDTEPQSTGTGSEITETSPDGGTDPSADTVTDGDETETARDIPTDTSGETAAEPDTDAEWETLIDFEVVVDGDRDAVILQLTDTQIIDASQARSATRLDSISQVLWGRDRLEQDYKCYLRDVIGETKPDFIFITGDVVYGEFDDSGEILIDFIAFMDSFKIPWAPVFGNHDNESTRGVDWQCQQFEASEYCLFRQRELTGNGNYTVGIVQNGVLTRVFFMMDSNGCGAISRESLANKHSTSTVGLASDQIKWFTETAKSIADASPDTRLSMAFHIQPSFFQNAFQKYGFTNNGTVNNPTNIDLLENKENTDFGYLGRDMKSPWDGSSLWRRLHDTKVDSIFCGHEHCNSGSVMYEGIRIQYGQKSSIYDRVNYLQDDGTIVGGYTLYGTPIVGGTVMTSDRNTGELSVPRIVLGNGETFEKPEQPDANYAYLLDFNGTDFDAAVYTADVKKEVCAKPDDSAPDGAVDGAYSGQSDYLVSVGVKFPIDIAYSQVSSVRIRMYVKENSNHTKNPLFRLYDDTVNSIRSDNTYASLGGQNETWCEIDVTELLNKAGLVKNDIVQPFTVVYRCYGADTVVWFDSVIVESAVALDLE